MRKRNLGSIEVSEIGMGCMGFSHGYGEIPDEDYSVEAIRAAHDYGCTFFDTAEGYGSQLYGEGHNEKLLGRAVAPFRKDVVLATKTHFMGEPPEGASAVRDFMRARLEKSLERLGTGYVDLYYLHRMNREVPVEHVAEAMAGFAEEGLIRGWGLSQVDVDTIAAAHAAFPLSAVQNLYNMLERGCEEAVIPFCEDHGIGLVPFSPVASGFLSGKVTASTDFGHADDVRKFVPQLTERNIEANRPVLDLLAEYADAKGATPAQVSLAWMLAKSPCVVPIPGSKNRGRILENLGACEVGLTAEEFAALDSALAAIPVRGHRGFVEFDGDTMEGWER